MSRNQNAEQSHSIQTDNRSSESEEELK